MVYSVEILKMNIAGEKKERKICLGSQPRIAQESLHKKLISIGVLYEYRRRREIFMGRDPILECRRKPEYPGKTCEDEHGSATKLTYGATGNRTRAAAVRGECIDHYTNSSSLSFV